MTPYLSARARRMPYQNDTTEAGAIPENRKTGNRLVSR